MCDKSADADMSANNEFVRRLFALPVMADAYGQLSSLYYGTKERNRLLRMTMETAESGVGMIVNTAQPVLSKFDRQVLMLNNIACTQLDWLENSCPIITKPTDEVVNETKKKCTGAIQPVVNCVNSVKDYGYDKVSGIRNYTSERIEGVRRYGADTVAAATKVGSDQVTKVLSTQLCRGVLNKFDAALDVADHCVDNYLPENNEEIEKSKKALEADMVVLSKAYQLGSKVQRRLYTRASKRLEKVQFQAKETIARLNLVISWMELTKSGAKEKARHIWQEIMKNEDQVIDEATKEDVTYDELTFERRAIATARQLMTKLKGVVAWIDSTTLSSIHGVPGAVQDTLHSSVALVQTLPESLRERVARLGNMVHSLSEAFSNEKTSVKDLPQSVLDNARNTVHQLYDSLTDLIDWTLKNTSGYHKIGQLFHRSEKSSSSESSEESETDRRNELFDDKNQENQEKNQKETSEMENSDDRTSSCDTKTPKCEEKNHETEKTDENASPDHQSGDGAEGKTISEDDEDDQQDKDVSYEEKDEYQ